MKKLSRKFVESWPQPAFTRFRTRHLFDWMNKNAMGKKILNLGSGQGTFDAQLDSASAMINVDIATKGRVDVVADAHWLPFKDNSFDIVYSIAVLEHVRKPWVVAEEMTRILKTGGHVVLELPFLNVVHDAHDYFRFTDKGIRSLFDATRFETVMAQVSSGGGSFLSVFVYVYFRQFVPTKLGKFLWDKVMAYPCSWLKYADICIHRSPDLRMTANSFCYIGKKR